MFYPGHTWLRLPLEVPLETLDDMIGQGGGLGDILIVIKGCPY